MALPIGPRVNATRIRACTCRLVREFARQVFTAALRGSVRTVPPEVIQAVGRVPARGRWAARQRPCRPAAAGDFVRWPGSRIVSTRWAMSVRAATARSAATSFGSSTVPERTPTILGLSVDVDTESARMSLYAPRCAAICDRSCRRRSSSAIGAMPSSREDRPPCVSRARSTAQEAHRPNRSSGARSGSTHR